MANPRSETFEAPDLPARPEGRPTRGVVIAFEPYRQRIAELRREAHADVEWDRLPGLVQEAWSWRDPDTLAALEACVARLKVAVLREWGLG